MAFATADEVGTRLDRTLTAGEEAAVELLLEGATSVIAEAAGKDDAWAAALSPVPVVLRTLCIEKTTEALANPDNHVSFSEALGDFNYAERFKPEGIFLTEMQERQVRRAVYGTSSGSSRPKSIVGDFYPEDE